MWIYEQTKPEENLSLLPQTVSLPVQKAEPALPTVPETAPEPVEQLPSKEPCIPAKRHATRDCWLLAAAFLLGSSAAGVLQAVCDARQAELLRYYLEAWQGMFAPGSMQGTVQLCAAGGWKAILPALLWTGLPAAAASGCLCFFGACALQVSSRIHAYSFRKHPGGQARPGVQALMGQYLLTMVVLLPLCGAAAGLSYLGSRL